MSRPIALLAPPNPYGRRTITRRCWKCGKLFTTGLLDSDKRLCWKCHTCDPMEKRIYWDFELPHNNEPNFEGYVGTVPHKKRFQTLFPEAPTIPELVSERNPHGTEYVQRLIELVDRGMLAPKRKERKQKGKDGEDAATHQRHHRNNHQRTL